MTDDRHADEIVNALLPLSGPYSPDQTVRAVFMISELVRYLNYATQEPAGLPYPNTPADVLGGLHEALKKVPQLLEQLQQRLSQFAADPAVIDYRRLDADTAAAHESAATQIAEANAFLDTAAAQIKALDQTITTAQNRLNGVGVPHTSDDEESTS